MTVYYSVEVKVLLVHKAPVDLLLSRFIELGSHQIKYVLVDPFCVSTVNTFESRRTWN